MSNRKQLSVFWCSSCYDCCPHPHLQEEGDACRGRSRAGKCSFVLTGDLCHSELLRAALLPCGIKCVVMWPVLWTVGDSNLGAGIRLAERLAADENDTGRSRIGSQSSAVKNCMKTKIKD